MFDWVSLFCNCNRPLLRCELVYQSAIPTRAMYRRRFTKASSGDSSPQVAAKSSATIEPSADAGDDALEVAAFEAVCGDGVIRCRSATLEYLQIALRFDRDLPDEFDQVIHAN